MITQIKKQFIINYRFIIISFLSCLVLFIFPFLIFSQEYKPRGNSDSLERTNIEYTASNFRDPFYPQVTLPQEEEEEEQPEIIITQEKVQPRITELFSFSIQGIIWNPDNPMAIINNQVLKKGDVLTISGHKDTAADITIVDIERDDFPILHTVMQELNEIEYDVKRNLNLTLIEKGGRNEKV
jgi:hypothetical protein